MKTPIVEAHYIPTEEEEIEELTELLRQAELESKEADKKAAEAKRKTDKLKSELVAATSLRLKGRSGKIWISTGLVDSTDRKVIYVRDRVTIRNSRKGEFRGRVEGIVLGTNEAGEILRIGFEDTDRTTWRPPHTCTVIGRGT